MEFLDVLDFCGTIDSVARQFAETTLKFYDVLNAQGQTDNQPISTEPDPSSAIDTLENFAYLFTTPSDSASV